MPKPLATFLAFHKCSQTTAMVPHVGGPIMGSGVNVLMPLPAVLTGDTAICIGPSDKVIATNPCVIIQNKPAVMLGDPSVHGGTVLIGSPTVIGG